MRNLFMMSSMRIVTVVCSRKVFRSHGEFCATQPWEVRQQTIIRPALRPASGNCALPTSAKFATCYFILQVIVATLTFLVCILTVWGKHSDQVCQAIICDGKSMKMHKTKKQETDRPALQPGQEQSPLTPPAWSMMELVVMTFIR